MIILGLNLFHADSSASLIVNENLVSAIEEERFTKIKHYAGVPKNAIQYCLNSSNLEISDVDYIAVNYKSKYNFWHKTLLVLKILIFQF